MKDIIKRKISDIMMGNLSDEEKEEVSNVINGDQLNFNDNMFFKDIAREVSGDIKALVSLAFEFRKDLQSKVNDDLNDIATEYIPQATDQLEGIIDATENAANKIMDNLESLEKNISDVKNIVASFKNGKIVILGQRKKVGQKSIEKLMPVIENVESLLEYNLTLISDSFVQMSFQDLTGQRIKRIIEVVIQMEEKIKNMAISFGIRIREREKNPEISAEELERVVERKKTELSSFHGKGVGLDQNAIDELLANL